MESLAHARIHVVPGTPARRPGAARGQKSIDRARKISRDETRWDLDSLQPVQNATQRVRASWAEWNEHISGANELMHARKQRQTDLVLEERNRRLELQLARRTEEQQREQAQLERQLLAVVEEAEQAQEDEERRRARMRDCAACLEQHDMSQMTQLACEHWYCRDDLENAIASACTSRRPFQCCQQTVLPDLLQQAIAAATLEQYSLLLEEVGEADPTYCSHPACAAFIPSRLATNPDQIQCTRCGHSTCRHCKGPSHGQTECPADVATQQARTLAQKQGWKACPRCANMVEKSSGCMHMTCRCSARFCYRCGRLLTQCGDQCG